MSSICTHTISKVRQTRSKKCPRHQPTFSSLCSSLSFHFCYSFTCSLSLLYVIIFFTVTHLYSLFLQFALLLLNFSFSWSFNPLSSSLLLIVRHSSLSLTHLFCFFLLYLFLRAFPSIPQIHLSWAAGRLTARAHMTTGECRGSMSQFPYLTLGKYETSLSIALSPCGSSLLSLFSHQLFLTYLHLSSIHPCLFLSLTLFGFLCSLLKCPLSLPCSLYLPLL